MLKKLTRLRRRDDEKVPAGDSFVCAWANDNVEKDAAGCCAAGAQIECGFESRSKLSHVCHGERGEIEI